MKALFKSLLLVVLVFGFSAAVNAQESKTKKDKYSNVNESIESNTTQQVTPDLTDYAKNNPVNKPEYRTADADRVPNKNTIGTLKSDVSATNKEQYYAKRERLIKNDKRVNAKLSKEATSKHPNAISPAQAQKWIQENESQGTKGSTQSTNE